METQAPRSEIENFKRTTAEDSAKCQPRPSQALRGCVAHTPPKATLESQIPFTPVVIPEFWGAYRGCAGDKRQLILGVHGPCSCPSRNYTTKIYPIISTSPPKVGAGLGLGKRNMGGKSQGGTRGKKVNHGGAMGWHPSGRGPRAPGPPERARPLAEAESGHEAASGSAGL